MNKTRAIRYLYPTAVPGVDFRVLAEPDGTQTISLWNLDEPIPSEYELEQADAQAAVIEANTTPPPTIEERLQATEDALTALLGL